MRFIVFEGLDGSGKSTLMLGLKQELERSHIRVVMTREPGGTPLGDEIRNLILRVSGDAPTARTELLLYEASRAQHVDKVIQPALSRKDWVLCDRFSASSLAFQAGGRQIPESEVEKLNDFATANLQPHLTVLLDLSVEDSQKRREKRVQNTGTQSDRIENEKSNFHQKVRESFLAQAKKHSDTWLVLDATKTPEQLKTDLLNYLKAKKWLES